MEDTRATGNLNLPDKNKIPHLLALNYLLMIHLKLFLNFSRAGKLVSADFLFGSSVIGTTEVGPVLMLTTNSRVGNISSLILS